MSDTTRISITLEIDRNRVGADDFDEEMDAFLLEQVLVQCKEACSRQSGVVSVSIPNVYSRNDTR